LASWATTQPNVASSETIRNFRYLNNSASICCILGGGDIVLVKVETEIHEERIEVIGNVEGGILAAEWTVDEEVLAIASGIHIEFSSNRWSLQDSIHDFWIRNHFRSVAFFQ
jgi:elongator complex protein 1